jgi:hypothetical protein
VWLLCRHDNPAASSLSFSFALRGASTQKSTWICHFWSSVLTFDIHL